MSLHDDDTLPDLPIVDDDAIVTDDIPVDDTVPEDESLIGMDITDLAAAEDELEGGLGEADDMDYLLNSDEDE